MKYLVTKWLFKNHFHHRSASDPPLGSPSDFNDMYDILVDKGIEFYDANWFTKSFQIRLGKPKMRARRVLTLPPYSMQLCLHESGVVRLFPDLDDYPEVTHVRRALGGWPKYARLQFSTHPHVTHDGNPCLGDFSNPWATCLRNNDLLMFVNVAKSFLNNWTRGDAYWDINRVHRNWEQTGKRRGISFADWHYYRVQIKAVVNEQNTRNNRSPYRFIRTWSTFVNNGTFNKMEALGYDALDVMLYHAVHHCMVRPIWDTRNGDMEQIIGMTKRMRELYISTHTIFSDNFPLNFKCYNWTEDALTNSNNRQSRSLMTRDARWTVDSVLENMKYGISQLTHDSDSLGPLFDYSDILTSKKLFSLAEPGDDGLYHIRADRHSYLAEDQCKLEIGRFIYNNMFRGTGGDFPKFIEMLREMVNINPEGIGIKSEDLILWEADMKNIISFHSRDDNPNDWKMKIGEISWVILLKIAKACNPDITVEDRLTMRGFVEQYRQHFHIKAWSLMEESFRQMTRRIIRGKEEQIHETYGKIAQSDSGENQLSIEPF